MSSFAAKVWRRLTGRERGGRATPLAQGTVIGVWLGMATTRLNLSRNRGKAERRLEIGPGTRRIPGFETLNVLPGAEVDYVWDATRRLPFETGSFDLVYASHILEHVPWYQTQPVLDEWARILKPGGSLEIWLPNGLKICQAFVDAELHGNNYIHEDGWYRFNEERDPCKWAAGRIFTYGDGKGRLNHPNWHRALFSPRYLRQIMERAGLEGVHEMDRREVRSTDHGWINLGMKGTKRSGPALPSSEAQRAAAPAAR